MTACFICPHVVFVRAAYSPCQQAPADGKSLSVLSFALKEAISGGVVVPVAATAHISPEGGNVDVDAID